MAARRGSRIGKWISIALLCALLAGGAFAYLHRGEIRDTIISSTFDASPRIVEIGEAIDPTSLGKRTYFASQPTIGGREQFAEWCAGVDHSEQGHVLGCYAGGRIHLFEVSDARLDGIVEVTAAHELLHAVYARLDARERDELHTVLVAEYERLSEADPELRSRMSVYEQLSQNAFTNELHSVLGTEVADLSETLEAHYAQYFEHRDEILRKYDAYHSVFTELSARAAELGEELEALRADIERRTLEYDEAVREFNADAADFKLRNERYEFSGKKELFDTTRFGLISRQEYLEETLAGLTADTDRFNALRDELIALNDVSTELNDVLDSRLPTPTTRPESSE